MLGLLAITGCAEEWGPVPRTLARVQGRVHLGASPIRGGWVEFSPIDGTVGVLRSAPIGADGRFEATGVAVGTNLIRLAHPPPLDTNAALNPRIYWVFQQSYSPIRRTIQGPSDDLDLDLLQEAAKPEVSEMLSKLGFSPP